MSSGDDPIIVGTRAEMAARGRVGGLTTASRYDMAEFARRARGGLAGKWLREAGGDPAKADVLRRLHFAKLALSAQIAATARREKRTASAVASAETVNAINDRGDDHDPAS